MPPTIASDVFDDRTYQRRAKRQNTEKPPKKVKEPRVEQIVQIETYEAEKQLFLQAIDRINSGEVNDENAQNYIWMTQHIDDFPEVVHVIRFFSNQENISIQDYLRSINNQINPRMMRMQICTVLRLIGIFLQDIEEVKAERSLSILLSKITKHKKLFEVVAPKVNPKDKFKVEGQPFPERLGAENLPVWQVLIRIKLGQLIPVKVSKTQIELVEGKDIESWKSGTIISGEDIYLEMINAVFKENIDKKNILLKRLFGLGVEVSWANEIAEEWGTSKMAVSLQKKEILERLGVTEYLNKKEG